LENALTDFLGEAARYLQTDIDCGSEIAFEIERRGSSRARTPLYCYRPLTVEFMGQRWRALGGLASHAPATAALEGFEGLDRYLDSHGSSRRPAEARASKAQVALWMLLEDVFGDQTDFALHPERMERALDRLEQSARAGTCESTVVATLHGMTMASAAVPLTGGLQIVQPGTLEELPDEAGPVGPTDCVDHLVVVFATEREDPEGAVLEARTVLRELLGALRLFGDGRVALGELAWQRSAGGRWRPWAPGEGGRPHGMLVLAESQEDELRAFCSLVSRRAPHGNPMAWALRRFQLGCARSSEYDALSDYLLALSAILEPEGSPRGAMAGRLAALCAPPSGRAELIALVMRALDLERDVIEGAARRSAAAEDLVRTLANHLRALLRDVICGHLDADLATFADTLLASEQPLDDESPAAAGRRSLVGDRLSEFARHLGAPAADQQQRTPAGERTAAEPAVAQQAAARAMPRRAAVKFERTAAQPQPPDGDAAIFDDDEGDEQLRLAGTPG
jgi:hypothetical protein